MQPKNNPYIVTGTILVPVTTTITAMPGTIILIEKSASCTALVEHPAVNESGLPAIIVRGRFDCIGTQDNRITIGTAISDSGRSESSWYGLIFEGERASVGTVAFADIRGAFRAVHARASSPLVRNVLAVNNHVGIYCESGAAPSIHNCNIMYNRASGVMVDNASPKIFSCIIAFNMVGVTGDRRSSFEMRNNCFWRNTDGSFVDAPPEYGLLKTVNNRKDSSDFRNNIFIDPVFMGTLSHRDSIEKDIRVATDTTKADVANRKLSRMIVESIPDSVKRDNEWKKPHHPWQLSRYSRLVDAGLDKSSLKDEDGSINDIGIYGAQEILPRQKKKK
jgi:hypothetical protein